MIVIPPVGIVEINARFGDIRSYIQDDGTLSLEWELEKIVRINLPSPMFYANDSKVHITKITVHKELKDVAAALYADIWSQKLEDTLGPYGGGFIFRTNKNRRTKISTHAWGIAWDWDPAKFCNGSSKTRDPRLRNVLHKYGFLLGEEFETVKDPMHFQFCTHY
jgi:D-alanyl-D-alanine carboxypeptidase